MIVQEMTKVKPKHKKKDVKMIPFPLHDISTAPDESKPLLESSQKAFGRLPGLHQVMAESP